MRTRWQLILPVVGLLIFTLVSYESLRSNREVQETPSRYFWWSFIRLNSDPLNQHPPIATPCKDAQNDCGSWDPGFLSVEPGPLARLLTFSAAPAFVIGMLVVRCLRRIGISEVSSFMVSMPLLIGAWYSGVGWLIDRWRFKRQQRS